MEAVVAEPVRGKPVDVRRVEAGAEAPELREAGVVEHDEHHVRCARNGSRQREVAGCRLFRGEAGPRSGLGTHGDEPYPRSEPGCRASEKGATTLGRLRFGPEEVPVTLVQAPTKNQRLVRWIDEMVELCQPDAVHWCDGSDAEFEMLCEQLVEAGTFVALDPRAPPRLLLGAFRPQRRRTGRGPHVHLLRARDRRRSHEQLEGPRRDAGDARPAVPGLHARPHDVRRAVQHGTARLAAVVHRRRDHRFAVRRGEHAHDDPRRAGHARRARSRRRLRAVRALGGRSARSRRGRTFPGRATPTRSGSCTSPRHARSGRSDPATAGTRCSARSASRCGSRRSSRATKAGSPSTCSC